MSDKFCDFCGAEVSEEDFPLKLRMTTKAGLTISFQVAIYKDPVDRTTAKCCLTCAASSIKSVADRCATESLGLNLPPTNLANN